TGVLSLAMLLVVGYSVKLLARGDSGDHRALERSLMCRARLQGELSALVEFRAKREELCRALLTGRTDLAQAGGRLERLMAEYHGWFNPMFRKFLPNPASEGDMTAYLLNHCARQTAIDRSLAPRLARLRQQGTPRAVRVSQPSL